MLRGAQASCARSDKFKSYLTQPINKLLSLPLLLPPSGWLYEMRMTPPEPAPSSDTNSRLHLRTERQHSACVTSIKGITASDCLHPSFSTSDTQAHDNLHCTKLEGIVKTNYWSMYIFIAYPPRADHKLFAQYLSNLTSTGRKPEGKAAVSPA